MKVFKITNNRFNRKINKMTKMRIFKIVYLRINKKVKKIIDRESNICFEFLKQNK